MKGKNSKNKMTFETAKDVIDYILDNEQICDYKAVVWDFIGGEPFLEIDLIDKITDYIKIKMYISNHHWFSNYRLAFSTNGLLYRSKKVQKYIEKNKGHISIGLSIDGNKMKHDLQRVYPDGVGSYDDVMYNAELWLEQFPQGATKATFSREDLPYLKDSIISLWNLGIKSVSANVVFEDVWQDGDDILFENELKSLADYIISKKLWNDYSVRFFDPSIGFPLREEEKKANFCGAGKMLAVDCEGNFFPCIRFLDFSLSKRKGRCIGSYKDGVNDDFLKPFEELTLEHQSTNECINCEVASGCSWCTAYNYDESKIGSIYDRVTYNCKMHKANVRANKYFWELYKSATGEDSPRDIHRINNALMNNSTKYLMIMISDIVSPHCNYESNIEKKYLMSEEIFMESLKFCTTFDFIPVIMNDSSDILNPLLSDSVNTLSVLNNNKKGEHTIYLCKTDYRFSEKTNATVIVQIDSNSLEGLGSFIIDNIGKIGRINIAFTNLTKWTKTEVDKYRLELKKVVSNYKKQINSDIDKYTEISVLTDWMEYGKKNDCGSGKTTFAVGPDGNVYDCPAFFFCGKEYSKGNIFGMKPEILVDVDSLQNMSNIAFENEGFCKYANLILTKEIYIPSKIQQELQKIEKAEAITMKYN
jgi:radical SAM peptide maturase (CXXX-repeat target family)/CXXX repeat peptide maturase